MKPQGPKIAERPGRPSGPKHLHLWRADGWTRASETQKGQTSSQNRGFKAARRVLVGWRRQHGAKPRRAARRLAARGKSSRATNETARPTADSARRYSLSPLHRPSCNGLGCLAYFPMIFQRSVRQQAGLLSAFPKVSHPASCYPCCYCC